MPVFSHADTQRPGFSSTMELLCCLPPAPANVPLSALVADLRLTTQYQAHQLIEKLKAAGFAVIVHNIAERGRVASISPPGWLAAEEAGETYWRAMYDEDKNGGPVEACNQLVMETVAIT